MKVSVIPNSDIIVNKYASLVYKYFSRFYETEYNSIDADIIFAFRPIDGSQHNTIYVSNDIYLNISELNFIEKCMAVIVPNYHAALFILPYLAKHDIRTPCYVYDLPLHISQLTLKNANRLCCIVNNDQLSNEYRDLGMLDWIESINFFGISKDDSEKILSESFSHWNFGKLDGSINVSLRTRKPNPHGFDVQIAESYGMPTATTQIGAVLYEINGYIINQDLSNLEINKNQLQKLSINAIKYREKKNLASINSLGRLIDYDLENLNVPGRFIHYNKNDKIYLACHDAPKFKVREDIEIIIVNDIKTALEYSKNLKFSEFYIYDVPIEDRDSVYRQECFKLVSNIKSKKIFFYSFNDIPDNYWFISKHLLFVNAREISKRLV